MTDERGHFEQGRWVPDLSPRPGDILRKAGRHQYVRVTPAGDVPVRVPRDWRPACCPCNPPIYVLEDFRGHDHAISNDKGRTWRVVGPPKS